MRENRRTRVIFGVLLLIAMTLVVLDLRDSAAGNDEGGIRGFATRFFGPVETAFSAVVTPVRNVVSSIGSWGSKDQRIADLEAENARLRGELATSDYDRNRLAQLDKLMHLAGVGQYRVVPAQVIAVGPAQGFAWTVTLDAGSRDGIKADQAVVTGDGLVGRVLSVGPSTATVLLVVDSTSTVGGRVEASLQIGFVSGLGKESELSFQLRDPFAGIKVGDRLVTFGVKGGVYPPGIPVGTITSVKGTPGQLTRYASVVPFVDPSALDLVGVVVVAPRTDPRDSVLPVRPTTSPSTTPSPAASGSPSPRSSTSSSSSSGSSSASPSAAASKSGP